MLRGQRLGQHGVQGRQAVHRGVEHPEQFQQFPVELPRSQADFIERRRLLTGPFLHAVAEPRVDHLQAGNAVLPHFAAHTAEASLADAKAPASTGRTRISPGSQRRLSACR